MNNQREIYEALLAGETLIAGGGTKVKLKDGNLFNVGARCQDSWNFSNIKDWEVYKEPEWYENIPEGGVLCWPIRYDLPLSCVTLVKKFNSRYQTPYTDESGCSWLNVEPLTKQEIQVYLDNAPKE